MAAYKLTYIRVAETPRAKNLEFYNIINITFKIHYMHRHNQIVSEIISQSFSEAKKNFDVSQIKYIGRNIILLLICN